MTNSSSNPEFETLALEDGVAVLALASSQAASVISVQNLPCARDNIVSSTDLHGGTSNMFAAFRSPRWRHLDGRSASR